MQNVEMKIFLSGCSAAGARAGTLFTFVSFTKAAARSANKTEQVFFFF
jgi:hypothetical protein